MITETIDALRKTTRFLWSPSFMARLGVIFALIEGQAAVWEHLRIPGQFTVTHDAAATAANILSNEALFRLGVTLVLIAVAFHIASLVAG
jgi:hypothetical protein